MKISGILILMALTISLILYGFIVALPRDQKAYDQKQLNDVADCKLHTTDVDWCYKSFYKVSS